MEEIGLNKRFVLVEKDLKKYILIGVTTPNIIFCNNKFVFLSKEFNGSEHDLLLYIHIKKEIYINLLNIRNNANINGIINRSSIQNKYL